MAGPDDVLKVGLGIGIGVGIGLLLGTERALPEIRDRLRPLAKTAVKSAILLAERGRELAAEFGEVIEDAAAEAHAELETERAASVVSMPSPDGNGPSASGGPREG